RKASGSVRQHDVDATGPGGADRVEDHGRRIALFLRDYRNIVALTPCFELFAGSGAEGIARRHEHRSALGLEIFGELADRRGLARAVYTGEQDYEGLVST